MLTFMPKYWLAPANHEILYTLCICLSSAFWKNFYLFYFSQKTRRQGKFPLPSCIKYHLFFQVFVLKRTKTGRISRRPTSNTITVAFNGTATVTLLRGERVIDQQTSESRAEFIVPDPLYWNAEQPYLYTLRIEAAGETITQKVGLRSIKIAEDGRLLVNGLSTKLWGVNRHDTHPTNGWSMTDEELLSELKLMKRMHINCIRTSHYPPTPKYLNFCDELGFYVILETDHETID